MLPSLRICSECGCELDTFVKIVDLDYGPGVIIRTPPWEKCPRCSQPVQTPRIRQIEPGQVTLCWP